MWTKLRPHLLHFLAYGVLFAALAVTLFPIVWVLAASFKMEDSLFSGNLFPRALTLKNYERLLAETPFWTWMKNTLILCSFTTLVSLFATTTAGYAFSRFRFSGRKGTLMAVILLQMFPSAMAMVAIFKLLIYMSRMSGGLVGLNTLSGLILIYAAGSIPFSTWMVKGYVDSLPRELEESAYIDGASHWQTFTRIVFPLMGPILAVVAIFNFIAPYTDFLLPSVVLTGAEKYTLAVGMRSFIANQFSTNWSQFAAASTLGSIPILVVFMSLQRFLVEGLTKGAVKG
ncbi:MAG: sugar ABC transporter permease [Armatimonadetes bacterium]|nr:sugar ABC transporter permease [Armatimonadota bacterium]